MSTQECVTPVDPKALRLLAVKLLILVPANSGHEHTHTHTEKFARLACLDISSVNAETQCLHDLVILYCDGLGFHAKQGRHFWLSSLDAPYARSMCDAFRSSPWAYVLKPERLRHAVGNETRTVLDLVHTTLQKHDATLSKCSHESLAASCRGYLARNIPIMSSFSCTLCTHLRQYRVYGVSASKWRIACIQVHARTRNA